jgi:hypothetical protein
MQARPTQSTSKCPFCTAHKRDWRDCASCGELWTQEDMATIISNFANAHPEQAAATAAAG